MTGYVHTDFKYIERMSDPKLLHDCVRLNPLIRDTKVLMKFNNIIRILKKSF